MNESQVWFASEIKEASEWAGNGWQMFEILEGVHRDLVALYPGMLVFNESGKGFEVDLSYNVYNRHMQVKIGAHVVSSDSLPGVVGADIGVVKVLVEGVIASLTAR